MSILTALTPLSRVRTASHYALAYTLAAGLVLGFAATPAYATSGANERMPSSWELSEPGQEGAVTTNTETPATGAAAAATSPAASAPTPSAARNMAANDPCPSPRVAKSNRPDDLAKVQEDIDRFSLCVQRAQLLERLNESAERATQTVDSALGFAPPAASAALPSAATGRGMMPPLPAAAMGGIDVSPAPSAPATTSNRGGTSGGSTAAASQNTTDAQDVKEDDIKVAAKPAWVIREIFGSVTDMQARLLSAEGNEILARQGTRLPDGTVITTITPSGVTVRADGAVKSLDWSGN